MLVLSVRDLSEQTNKQKCASFEKQHRNRDVFLPKINSRHTRIIRNQSYKQHIKYGTFCVRKDKNGSAMEHFHFFFGLDFCTANKCCLLKYCARERTR